MKPNSAFWGACLILFAFAGCTEAASQAAAEDTTDLEAAVALPKPESVSDRAAYGIGLNLGHNLRAQDVNVDLEYLVRGLLDGARGGEPLLSPEEMSEAIQTFQQELMERQQAAAAAAGASNRAEAETFFASNGGRAGVVTLPSGLQYEVLVAAEGPKPEASSRVTAHYRGTLLDGTVFDSSYDRGQPATFALDRVIAGWSEALQLMAVGSKWKLFIPADLAYGATPPPGGPIGPDATLVFEVELLGIE